MKFNDLSTLGEIKAFLKEKWLSGAPCPACNQHVKLYKLKINATAVSDLIRLFHMVEGEADVFEHVSGFSRDRGGAFAKLAHWGLVTDMPNDDTTKRTSGMWAMTQKGRKFVEQELEVPQYAYLYNSECKLMSPNTVDIVEALGNKFDYAELMSVTT